MSENAQDLRKVTQRRRPPHGPGARMMPGEKAKDFKGTIAKLVRFMGQFKVSLAVAIVFAIFSAAFSIVGPKVLSQATTELFNGIVAKIGGTGGINFDAIAGIIGATLALYLVSAACSFLQGWMMSSVSQRTCYGLRRAIAEKIDRVPVGYFERNSIGDTLSRITNDVDTLGQSLNQGVTQMITSITTLIGVVAMMVSINLVMTGITLVMLPVSLVLIMVVVKLSQKHFRAQQEKLGEINGQVEETFSGHAIVRAFNQEQACEERFEETNDKLYESAWKSQFLSGLMQPVMNFVGNLGYVAVALAGSVFAVQGAITVGDIQAFIQYVKNFTQPITQLTQVSNVLQQMAAAAERIFAFLEEEEVAPEEPKAQTSQVPCNVEFDHVRFGYSPDKPVINDFRRRSPRARRSPSWVRRAPARRHGEAAHALLRRRRRRYPYRRRRCARFLALRRPLDVRDGAAGHMAVQRHDSREHPLWQARRDRRGSGGCGARGLRAPLHHHPARRLRFRDQRGRNQHQPRPAPASHDCACDLGEPAHAHSR